MIPFILNSRKHKTVVEESRSVITWSWEGANYKGKQEKFQGDITVVFRDCGGGYMTT